MYKIPKQYKDLRRHILYTDLKKIILFTLWMLVFLAGALFYNKNSNTYANELKIVGWRLAVWLAIAAVLGLIVFRMWTFFTNRTCAGKIHYAGLTYSYSSSEDPYAFKPFTYDTRASKKLHIIQKNGKKKRLYFEQKIGSYWYYNEGEEIVRFHGCPFPLNLDPEAKHGYVCVACGRTYESYIDECENCYLSIIDPAELEKQTRMEKYEKMK